MPERIHRVNGYAPGSYTYYPVVIIGAGESGIAMGCQLKEKLGFDQFRIFDRQSGIGGTWWINRYPGIACDIPAILYSFSFCPNPKWSAIFPPGLEIAQYFHDVCTKYEIIDKIQLNTDVEKCHWDESEQLWHVKLRHMVPGTGDMAAADRQKVMDAKGEHGVYTFYETVKAKILATAVGGLVEPNEIPKSVPGWEKFKGDVFHSARWRDDIDYTDKNVVVLGTGCSAAQIVPELPKAPWNARSVLQLMRTPPWVVPKVVPPGGNEKFKSYGPIFYSYWPGALWMTRLIMFLVAERDWEIYGNEQNNKEYRSRKEKWLVNVMKRRAPAEYHDILTPDYGIGCKRRIFDHDWLNCLNDPKIELSTQPLVEVKEKSIVLGGQRMYPKGEKVDLPVAPKPREVPADVVVLANGFNTTTWLHPTSVYGRGGKELVEAMEERGGPQAYRGTAMDGFPNFFIIFGPNAATGHNSVILATENMVQHSLKLMKPLLNGDASIVEVKKEAEIAYTQDIQAKLKKSVWHAGGCRSWYVRDDGWNATVFPYSQLYATWMYSFVKWSDWSVTYTAKGRRNLYIGRLLRLAIAVTAVAGALRLYREGASVESVQHNLKEPVTLAFDALQSGLRYVRDFFDV